MTAANHTGPPWELKRLLAGIGGPQAVIKRLPGGVEAIICLFVRSIGMSKDEQLANATLIQRAPDMFRCMYDLNKELYSRRQRRSSGVLQLNESSVQVLRTLLRELGGEPSL